MLNNNNRMLNATISYLASQETSIDDKKQAFDFFIEYVKNNYQEKIDLMFLVMKYISNNSPDEFKNYCNSTLSKRNII